MGCKCKERFNKINEKYGSGTVQKKQTLLVKAIEFIAQLSFGILCGGIIIVMAVPMLLWLIFNTMLGRETSFSVKNLNRFLK